MPVHGRKQRTSSKDDIHLQIPPRSNAGPNDAIHHSICSRMPEMQTEEEGASLEPFSRIARQYSFASVGASDVMGASRRARRARSSTSNVSLTKITHLGSENSCRHVMTWRRDWQSLKARRRACLKIPVVRYFCQLQEGSVLQAGLSVSLL